MDFQHKLHRRRPLPGKSITSLCTFSEKKKYKISRMPHVLRAGLSFGTMRFLHISCNPVFLTIYLDGSSLCRSTLVWRWWPKALQNVDAYLSEDLIYFPYLGHISTFVHNGLSGFVSPRYVPPLGFISLHYSISQPRCDSARYTLTHASKHFHIRNPQ